MSGEFLFILPTGWEQVMPVDVDAIEGKKAQVVFLSAAERIIEAVKGETSKVM